MTANLSIKSNTEAPTTAGDWIMQQCQSAGIGDTTAFRLMTCVVEAVNNCVEHAYRETPGDIDIRLFRNSRWLVVKIQDWGPPAKYRTETSRPDPMQIDGRGWFIMQQWMDVAKYRRRNLKNVVILAKCMARPHKP